MKIDVVLSPPEIDLLPQRDLKNTTAVVFDVLRATSTIVTALAHGVAEIFPVRTIEEAQSLKARMPGAKLGGERHGDKIDGFDFGNSPLEYREIANAQIITTTTNGTIALRACEHAREVIAGALLNLGAIAKHVLNTEPAELLLVCAGTFRDLAFEDVLASGMLCSRFPKGDLTDSAQTALAVFEQHKRDLLGALRSSQNGRVLISKNRDDEVRWCARVSTFDVLGVLQNGAIRPLRT